MTGQKLVVTTVSLIGGAIGLFAPIGPRSGRRKLAPKFSHT
jgi:hypothetical protein